MFHSAALKLTIWYLGIIMALSICLSGIIYHLASNELIANTRRQVNFFNSEINPYDFSRFSQLRQRQLHEGIDRLKGNLLAFNLLVLAAGGGASYALARRTLTPIEETLESQKRFTGDASHELRTPLTVMQAENEVALRNPKLTKEQAKQQLYSNLEEVARLKNLSDGLLKLASTENPQLSKQPVSLKEIVNRAVERWRKPAEDKAINFKSKLDDVSVKADPESLVELVSIFIDNAIKYSPVGSRIKLTAGRRGRLAQIQVQDYGLGISAKDLPHIFDRFYQTDRSRSQPDGYGLGLSIAKKIAEAHNGVIDVSSAPGKGSTFTVSLPAA